MMPTTNWLTSLGALGVALLLPLVCPSLMGEAKAQSLLNEPRAAADPRLRTVRFAAETVIDVPVRRGQITQLVFGDDEQIVGMPISGKGSNCSDEAHTWCIGRQGRDLFVKPKTGATATNLIVVTDRRRHAFLLHPSLHPSLRNPRRVQSNSRPRPHHPPPKS